MNNEGEGGGAHAWDALKVWSFEGWRMWQKKQCESVGSKLLKEELVNTIGEKVAEIFTSAQVSAGADSRGYGSIERWLGVRACACTHELAD